MAKLSAKQEQELRNSFRGLVRKVQDETRGAKTNNKSVKWFKEIVSKAVRSRTKANPMVGRIYTFAYLAKTRQTLPYFDRFPLSVCIGKKEGRWWSINLHYLPPDMRAAFLEELIVKYADDKTKRAARMKNETQLRIDWKKMKGFNQKVFEHALTSYLPEQMKSQLMEVNPIDWHIAVALPSQQFVTYADGKQKRFSSQKVWSEL